MSTSLENFMERVPFGLLMLDKQGRIQKVNSTLESMFGYQQGELAGQNVEVLIPESRRAQHVEYRKDLANNSTIVAMGMGRVLIAQCKDGSEIHVEVMLDFQDDDEILATVVEVSEREKALEAVGETQKINKTGTWSFDLQANEVWWSPELFRIFNLPVSPLAPPYETHKSLFTQESWERLEPAVTAAAEKGTPYELELVLAQAVQDDTKRTAVARCEPQKDEHGKVIRLIGTFQDITELASAREDRDRLLERLTLAKKVSGIGIWDWDIQSGDLTWDDRVFEIYGLQGPFVEYKDWRNAVHPEDLAQAELDLQRAVMNRDVFSSHFRIMRGSEIRHVFAIATFSNEQMIGVNMDITELVSARAERDRLLERLTLAKTAAGIGIWEWDLETDGAVWDDQMYEIYGIDGPPTNYDHWRNALHPEDLADAEAGLQKAIENEGVFRNNFRIIRHGEIRHILAFAAASNGRMIGVNMDVTEQTLLREETRRINNLESLGALAGGIAHDFNNQLASISARSELLALKAGDAEFVSKVAQELTHAVERATSLTKQLLTFAKGGAPIRESASIEELVKHNVEFSLRGASLSVNYNFESNLWNADIDPNQVGQVIQNIVINAVQAMVEFGGRLSISARNIAVGQGNQFLEAGKYVELVFEDNGPGMSEQVMSHVFDPYYTTKAEGHGLGLSICHSIVTQHNGTISVSSAPGGGTRFTIRLPATDEPAQSTQDRISVLAGAGRVLIVDDMPDVLESMGDLVNALGYESELASSVQDATERFKQAHLKDKPFDLVITDLTMPGSGGGLEVLRNLKTLNPEINVIVTSGYANNAVTSDAELIGFAGKLNKPCSLKELGAEMHRVMQLG